MSDLIVFTFGTEDEAAEVLGRVATAKQENVQQALVKISDAAVAVKNPQGKVKIRQTLESLAKGGRVAGGGFWGLLIGLLLGGPLVGALVGIGLRAFGNRSFDLGIDNKFISEVSDALEPGHSVLFLLTEGTSPQTISDALGDHNGRLFHTSLSDDAASALTELADDEEIAGALGDRD